MEKKFKEIWLEAYQNTRKFIIAQIAIDIPKLNQFIQSKGLISWISSNAEYIIQFADKSFVRDLNAGPRFIELEEAKIDSAQAEKIWSTFFKEWWRQFKRLIINLTLILKKIVDENDELTPEDIIIETYNAAADEYQLFVAVKPYKIKPYRGILIPGLTVYVGQDPKSLLYKLDESGLYSKIRFIFSETGEIMETASNKNSFGYTLFDDNGLLVNLETITKTIECYVEDYYEEWLR